MIRALSSSLFAVAVALGAAGCGEKPQTADKGVRKTDAKASAGAQAAYHAPGWKTGDEADWQRQIQQRAQAQNEYARVGARKP